MGRKSAKGGRPALLTPEVHEKLIEATKLGSPMSVGAAYVGISVRSFERWMERGFDAEQLEDDGQPVPEEEKPYLALYKEVVQARSQAAVMSVGLIQRAARGGVVTEETVRKYRDPDTGAVIEEKTVKKSAPDWRAGAWYLERQHRQHFGKDKEVQVELSGPNGGPVEVVAVDDLAARIQANIQAGIAAQEGARQLTAGPDPDEIVVDPDEDETDTPVG